jgi:hypothetical protein
MGGRGAYEPYAEDVGGQSESSSDNDDYGTCLVPDDTDDMSCGSEASADQPLPAENDDVLEETEVTATGGGAAAHQEAAAPTGQAAPDDDIPVLGDFYKHFPGVRVVEGGKSEHSAKASPEWYPFGNCTEAAIFMWIFFFQVR